MLGKNLIQTIKVKNINRKILYLKKKNAISGSTHQVHALN